MRVLLASTRGLLSGGLIAVAAPLLVNADPGAVRPVIGHHLVAGLAAIELLGAALFAFETTVAAGAALLLVAFTAATLIHAHHQQIP